jgi:nitroimidazol reductase NimA-like FMN-containing flavoprotein (pyridoxamine 5'-phosphate oxidase superfamily)
MSDEPLLESGAPGNCSVGPAAAGHSVCDLVTRLVREQPYAVLCTQGGGQPYGSLVALAVTDDLRSAFFATPVTTRKFRLLCDCEHVAFVIDNRSGSIEDMMEIEAITATGRARRVVEGREYERGLIRLIARHPQLENFARSPTTALFCVDIIRYFHVTRFQEVHQWTPSRG